MNKQNAKHLVKKLLSSQEGRAVLGKELGAKIMPKGSAPENAHPIVAALVPCYDHPEPRMQDAFIQMQKASQDHCIMYPGPPVSSSVIHWSRNWLIAGLIKTEKPWTHVLFIDDDIVPAPDALVKMLSHKKDIVAALCTRRMDPPIPNIRNFNESKGEYEEIWSWSSGLMEVGAAGTGMMLISREALNKVAEAYWKCDYEQEMFGLAGEKLARLQDIRRKGFDKTANAYWFRFLPALSGNFEMGEDVSFCFMATRYCGIKVYCDTTIQPGHVGEYVYSIQDFLPHQKLAILRAKAEKQWTNGEAKTGAIVSVLIPTRDREKQLLACISDLLSTAAQPENVEILIRVDSDCSPWPAGLPSQCRVLSGDRHGYRNLHRYYNELAAQATGEWLMLWNDDATMKTNGWDDAIRKSGSGLQVLNPTGQLNLFPIVHRSVYELLGHFAQQAHADTWLQEVSRAAQIERYVPLQIEHEPCPEKYEETRPEFFSEPMRKLREADAERIARALMVPA